MAPAGNALAIGEWITAWFEKRGKHLPLSGNALPDIDYLESGMIDSVAMIEFIMDIESEFRIRLTSQTMLDPRFSKLPGLVTIIDEATAR